MRLTVEDFNTTTLNVRASQMAKKLGLKGGDVLKVQSALFARDMMDASPPTNKEKSIKAAQKFSKNVFAPMPRDVPLLKKGGKKMHWLYAGTNFVLGVQKANLKDKVSLDGVKEIWRIKSRKKDFGARYYKLDRTKRTAKKQNGQRVMILQRTVVSKQNLKQFEKWLADSFGKLKGSWAVAYITLKPGASVPGWVKKHIESSKARGSRVVLNLTGENPFIAIVAAAKGVASEQEAKIIADQLRHRAGAIVKDMALYVSGKKTLADFGKGIL